MGFDEFDERFDSEVCEGHGLIVAEPVDPDHAVLGVISQATSNSQSSLSPRSAATGSIVVTRETLLTCMLRPPAPDL